MTPLHRAIVDLIRAEGPISIARYMALCLADPAHGYYRARDPIGASGDFITAPEISQMFGELVGVWIASLWIDMGRPPLLRLVELGPGRGVLMSDALRAMRKAPALTDALRLHLVETSPALRERQRVALDGAASVMWHDDVAEIPEGPAIVVANEFFDALPIRQFLRGDAGWRERMVDCDAGGALRFSLSVPIEPASWNPADLSDAPAGAIRETSPDSLSIVSTLARRLVAPGGAGLIIDYGHAGGFGDTLQAVRSHRFADPLADPGEADLTAHVDFGALAAAARAAGCAADGPITQAAFLRAMGLDARAEALGARADPAQKQAIAAAANRLTDVATPTGMGALFKAMALRPAAAPVLYPWSVAA